VIGQSGLTELYRYQKFVAKNSGPLDIYAFDLKGYDLTEPASPFVLNVKESNETVKFNYDSLATAVKIRMLDGTGKEIAVSFEVEAETGSVFTYNAPDVAGYYLTDSKAIGKVDPVLTDGASVLEFHYAKISSKLTIICKEDNSDGKVIRIVEVPESEWAIGAKYYNAPSLAADFYTPLATPYNVALITWDGINAAAGEAYYKKNLVNIPIHQYDVTTARVPISLTATLSGQRQGEAVTVGAPDLTGMILVGAAAQTLIADGVTPAEFDYRNPTPSEVVVKAVDQATGLLLQSYVLSGTTGETIFAGAPSILGWQLLDSQAIKSATVGTDKEIRFDYEKDIVKVTIKYIHLSTGREIIPQTVAEAPRNGNYLAYAPHIAGFVIDGKAKEALTGITGPAIITFNYRSLEEAVIEYLTKVTVTGISDKGETLYSYEKLVAKNSGKLDIYAFNVKGYQLSDPASPATLDIRESEQKLTFTYQSLATTVKILMVDAADKDVALAFDVAAEAGSVFTYNAPDVAGYYLTDSTGIGEVNPVLANGTSELKFHYAKITSKLTIVCKEDDPDGRVIRIVEIPEDQWFKGAKYYNAPDLSADYYSAKAAPNVVSITWDGSNAASAEAYYTKDTVSITINKYDITTTRTLIPPSATLTGQRKGETVAVGAPDLSGRILISDAIKTVIADGVTPVEFEYRDIANDQVAVKAVTIVDGLAVTLQSYLMNATGGDRIYVNAPVILGWKLAEADSTKSALIGTDKEIVFEYEKDTVVVKINLVNAVSGSPIKPAQLAEVARGSNYTAYAPHLAGYVIADVNASKVSFINLLADAEATFEYESLQEFVEKEFVDIIVQGVDKANAKELYSHIVRAWRDSTIDIEAFEVTGYELYSASPLTLTADGSKAKVVFEYSSKATYITVKAEQKDGSAVPEFGEIYLPAQYGQPVSCSAPYIPGYVLADGELLIQTIAAVSDTANTITFVYEKAEGNVMILLREEDGQGRVIMALTDDLPLGEDREYKIADYDLSPYYYEAIDPAQSHLVTGSEDIETIEFYYSKLTRDLKVSLYNDTKDEEIKTKALGSFPLGEVAMINAPYAEGLKLVSENPIYVIVEEGAGPQVVVVHYAQPGSNEVVVNAVNADTEEILHSYILTGAAGSLLTINAPTLTGWKLVAGQPEALSQEVPGAVAFFYEKDPEAYINIHYLLQDPDGNLLPDIPSYIVLDYTVLKGLDYTAYAPHVPGFKLAQFGSQKQRIAAGELTGSDYDVIFTYVLAGEYEPPELPTEGSLTVEVKYNDAFVPDAKVTVTGKGDLTYTAEQTTDITGTLVFTGLPFGDYEVKATCSGYDPASSTKTLSGDSESKANQAVTLSLGKTVKDTTGGGGGGSSKTPATMIVRAKNIKSGEVIYEQKLPVYVGDKHTVNAPSIDGYTLDSGSAASETITVKSGENLVVFYYNYSGDGGKGKLPVNDRIRETLEADDHISYIKGYPDGTVRPDIGITRAEVAMIFWRLLKTSAKNDDVGNSFRDVKDGVWYTQAINYLAMMGILEGYPDGSFKPNQKITRAEFTAIVARFDDLLTGTAAPFKDVPQNHWAYKYIVSSYSNVWIIGYPDGTFRPSADITRAEVVTIVNRMLGRALDKSDVPVSLNSLFIDLSPGHWAFADLIEASIEHDFEWKDNGYETWTNW
ncbi:MAG: S-layer homology domain-containing protein, partial [Clostridiales bacterium]|nr:S-layer homology domain-containing protein [Clostridiales bacterium]